MPKVCWHNVLSFIMLMSAEMALRNPDLDLMHRLLHHHQWSDIQDWIGALGTLADLTDAEIEQVAIPRQQGAADAECPGGGSDSGGV